jgi:hypothetical protein
MSLLGVSPLHHTIILLTKGINSPPHRSWSKKSIKRLIMGMSFSIHGSEIAQTMVSYLYLVLYRALRRLIPYYTDCFGFFIHEIEKISINHNFLRLVENP